MVNNLSLNFIRLIRVVITPWVTTLLRIENDSKQSDEIQAKTTFQTGFFVACDVLCIVTWRNILCATALMRLVENHFAKDAFKTEIQA